MGDNKVEIIVAVKDLASNAFKGISGATDAYNKTLHDLNGTANQVSQSVRNLFVAFGGYSVIKEAAGAKEDKHLRGRAKNWAIEIRRFRST